MRNKKKSKMPKIPSISYNFDMRGMTNTVIVAPAVVTYLVDNMDAFEEDTELPLSTYNIHTSIYCRQDLCYIFDEDGQMHTLRLIFDAKDYLLGEDDNGEE
jgi:hypothetical protein